MRPQGWSDRHAREEGVIMSVITNVNGVVGQMMTNTRGRIGQDTIAVVIARGMVDGRSLITSSARSRAWPHNDEGG